MGNNPMGFFSKYNNPLLRTGVLTKMKSIENKATKAFLYFPHLPNTSKL